MLGSADVVIGILRFEFAALCAEALQMDHSHFLQGKLQRGSDYFKPIFHAAMKVNGGGLLKIFGGTGNFSDAETEVDALRQHLVIEDEVVGVFKQRQLR
jgi:hypothetical protein